MLMFTEEVTYFVIGGVEKSIPLLYNEIEVRIYGKSTIGNRTNKRIESKQP